MKQPYSKCGEFDTFYGAILFLAGALLYLYFIINHWNIWYIQLWVMSFFPTFILTILWAAICDSLGNIITDFLENIRQKYKNGYHL